MFSYASPTLLDAHRYSRGLRDEMVDIWVTWRFFFVGVSQNGLELTSMGVVHLK
jgi:hypothetical protein